MDGVFSCADAGVVGHGEGGVDGHAGGVATRPLDPDAVDGKHAQRITDFGLGVGFLTGVRSRTTNSRWVIVVQA